MFTIALLCTGCVTMNDPEASQEYRADVVAATSPGHMVGQTFISRRPGMNTIQLWLRAGPNSAPPNGSLTLQLYHSSQDTSPLVTRVLSFDYVSKNNPVNLSFPGLPDPAEQSYYLTLKSTGGTFQALGRSEDSYPLGQAFVDGQPVDADLSFRLGYDYGPAAMLADFQRALTNIWLFIPLVLTLWLPGRLLLRLLGNQGRFDWGERTALSIGLSMALIPILMTWTTLVGVHWSQIGVWIILLGLTGLYIWLWWRDRAAASPQYNALDPASSPESEKHKERWINLALGVVFVATLAVRLAMARDLSAPPWVDSVHHAMITHLIVERGGFPPTYAPFLNIETANYHPGFHSQLAVFDWLSGMDIATAMLLFGQVLNALTVFAVYLFTTTFTEDRVAGVVAALVAGLFTPMPAYFTSWGRYTELASLVMLPAAMALIKLLLDLKGSGQHDGIHNSIERPQENPDEVASSQITFSPITENRGIALWRLLLLAGIACGGLFLTHYRVIIFLACLILAYLLSQVFHYIREGRFWRSLLVDAGLLALVALVAIGLTLPWWPSTLRTLVIRNISWGQGSVTAAFNDFSWSYLTSALGKYALWLAGAGLVLAIFLRPRFAFTMVVWVGLLFGLANLGVFGLPAQGFINNTSVEISLFLPVAALVGYLVGRVVYFVQRLLPARWHWVWYTGLAAIGIILALIAARILLPILNPVTMLFRQVDRPAMTWIQENIPPDETVSINPFWWGYGLCAGNDGGYWIVPMAGRKTMPPPALYGISNSIANIQGIAEVCTQVMEHNADPQGLHDELVAQGIHYVYIGGRGGVLYPGQMVNSGLFKELYHQDGTWVLEVVKE
jgi:hypothetical protein